MDLPLVQRATRRVATFAFRRPLVVLSVVALLSAIALFQARTLAVSADLAELLPEEAPSMLALERVQEEVGSTSTLAIVVESDDPEVLPDAVEAIAPAVEKVESVAYVRYRRPVEFFRRNALFFLDTDALGRLAEQIKERKKYELKQRNPLFANIGEEKPPPEIDLEAVMAEGSEGEGDAPGDEAWVRTQLEEPYFLDAEEGRILLIAYPAESGLDLGSSRRTFEAVRAAVDEAIAESGIDVDVRYGGGLVKRIEQQEQIEEDVGFTSLLALALILGYLALHFRRFGAVVLVMSPLLLGVLWTYGFAATVFEILNILTAFVAVILLGMGIDHGVHLLSRVAHELDDDDPEAGVGLAFETTGQAVFVAAATTTVGFGALTISEFRAFFEFGTLAAAGVTAVAAAYLVVMPALLALFLRFGWRPSGSQGRRPLLTGLYERLFARPRVVLALFAAAIVAAGFGVQQLRFDYDSRSMAGDLDSFELDAIVDGLLGHSQSPAILLTDTVEHTEPAAEILRQRKAERADSAIDRIRLVDDYIPDAQDEKLPVIEKIRRDLRLVKLDDVEDPDDRALLEAFIEGEDPETFTFETLPIELKRQFPTSEEGNLHERIIFVYSSLDLSDGRKAILFSEEVRDIEVGESTYMAVGPPLILADILLMVFDEIPKMGLSVVLLVFLVMLFILRNWRIALIAEGTAILTLLTAGALMPLFGVDFNYINVVIIAVAFGMSVDAAIHLIARMRDGGADPEKVAEVSGANFGAILTTMLGFGAMSLSYHPGVSSLAYVALLGLGTNAVLVVFFLPVLLERLQERGWL